MTSHSLSMAEFSELVESTLTWPTPTLSFSTSPTMPQVVKSPTRPRRIISTLKRRASSVFVSRSSSSSGQKRDRAASLPESPRKTSRNTSMESQASLLYTPLPYKLAKSTFTSLPPSPSSSSKDWSPPATPKSALPCPVYEGEENTVRFTKWDESYDDPFAKDGVQVLWEPVTASLRGSDRSTQPEAGLYSQKPLPPTPIPSPSPTVEDLNLGEYCFPLPPALPAVSPPPSPRSFVSNAETGLDEMREPRPLTPSSKRTSLVLDSPNRRRTISSPEKAKKARRPTTPMSELMKHWPLKQADSQKEDWTLGLPSCTPSLLSTPPPTSFHGRRCIVDIHPAPTLRVKNSPSRRPSAMEREFDSFLVEAGEVDIYPELAHQEEVWDTSCEELERSLSYISLEDMMKWRMEAKNADDDGLFYASRASLMF